MALLRAALPVFNKNPDGGVFILTSSVAVSRRLHFGLWKILTRKPGSHIERELDGVFGDQGGWVALDEVPCADSRAQSSCQCGVAGTVDDGMGNVLSVGAVDGGNADLLLGTQIPSGNDPSRKGACCAEIGSMYKYCRDLNIAKLKYGPFRRN
jgi:hypothetical protein